MIVRVVCISTPGGSQRAFVQSVAQFVLFVLFVVPSPQSPLKVANGGRQDGLLAVNRVVVVTISVDTRETHDVRHRREHAFPWFAVREGEGNDASPRTV